MAALYQHADDAALRRALVRWEHEGKHSAQTFPSKGQEAIAVGTAWRWKKATMSFRLFEPAVR